MKYFLLWVGNPSFFPKSVKCFARLLSAAGKHDRQPPKSIKYHSLNEFLFITCVKKVFVYQPSIKIINSDDEHWTPCSLYFFMMLEVQNCWGNWNRRLCIPFSVCGIWHVIMTFVQCTYTYDAMSSWWLTKPNTSMSLTVF